MSREDAVLSAIGQSQDKHRTTALHDASEPAKFTESGARRPGLSGGGNRELVINGHKASVERDEVAPGTLARHPGGQRQLVVRRSEQEAAPAGFGAGASGRHHLPAVSSERVGGLKIGGKRSRRQGCASLGGEPPSTLHGGPSPRLGFGLLGGGSGGVLSGQSWNDRPGRRTSHE
ncbi:Hypothetical predicted protein [Lynx pardinus]|uniref:Uncharacterized protein n=1 Tax=Lynx pardinus TaxID=191816 RepID=A0A485P157_LYNPA|nr:Hypothetical predicted protein [Lynx pardinus]